MSTTFSRASRGYIVIFASVISAIIMTITTAFFGYYGSAVHAERVALAGTQAQALAEAGIDKAIYELNQNGSYTGENNTALGGGTFTTSVASIDSITKNITVTSSVPNSSTPVATKTIRVTATIDSSIVSFRYGVQVGQGGVSMSNGSTITGNLFSNGNITGSGTITGDATVSAGVSPVADQQWTVQNSGFNVGDTSAHAAVAEAFRPSTSASLGQINLNLKKTGNPGDLTIKVVTDTNGKPSTNVLASGVIPSSGITTSYGFVSAALDGMPALSSGQTYWIIAIASVSSSNYITWGLDTGAGYPNGSAKYISNWQNSSWNSITGDLDFMLFLTGVATSISGVTVNGNAWAAGLSSCTVGGTASYQTIANCNVTGTKFPGTAPATPAPLPVSDAQIADWEAIAAAGGTIAGPYAPPGTVTLGPKKIDGDLTISNGAKLILSGPVWVNGNVTFSNNAFLSISPSTGTGGAVIIADATGNTAMKGIVNLSNNVTISGNGNANSFPMIVTTKMGSNAIELSNNAASVILYAPYGYVEISNGASANQVTAYKFELENNASISYVSGLQNMNFSNGPGGSWSVVPGTYALIN
ncbi:MAG: hypothetical protein PHD04_05320 [Candidatus Pacebacteria bacterium]|nr:hypothetical protein [Candidatus Paceibacterota bacterium]